MGKSTNRGRKTLIDEERGDTILIRTARENRRQRPSEKVDNFNPPPPQTKKKSARTIWRRLYSHGINSHKVRKTLIVSDINKNAVFSDIIKNPEVDNYCKIVFFMKLA